MVLGDLDGDGRLDAALISTEEAGVHFGTGNGGLSAPVIMAGDPARTFVDLAMADLDGDSLADLLCLEKTEGLSIFRNAGGRSFEAPPPLAVPGEAISLAAADLDGDGLAEATVAAHLTTVTGASGASMFVYRKRGESFVPDSGWAYALPFAPLGHKLADLDLDGTLDLVVFEYHTALVLFGNAAPAGTDLFRRGDSDAGGTIALTDAIAILNRLFLGGEALTCPDAADANDDGEINLSDPIAILFRLFLGGEPLPPPGPEDCGADPTPDGLPACLRGC